MHACRPAGISYYSAFHRFLSSVQLSLILIKLQISLGTLPQAVEDYDHLA